LPVWKPSAEFILLPTRFKIPKRKVAESRVPLRRCKIGTQLHGPPIRRQRFPSAIKLAQDIPHRIVAFNMIWMTSEKVLKNRQRLTQSILVLKCQPEIEQRLRKACS